MSTLLVRFYLFICLLFIYCSVNAQSELPTIYPTSLIPLKSDSDPAQYCIDNFLIDQKGRIWFKTCGVAQQLYALQVVQFDGYELWPLSIARDDWNGYLRSCLEGESSKVGLYGFLNRDSGVSALFTYSQRNNQIQYTFIKGFCGGIIEYLPGQFWVLTKEKEKFVLNDWDGFELQPFAEIPNRHYDYEFDRFIIKEDIPFTRIGDQLWFCDQDMPVFSYHLQTKEIQKFTAEDFPNLGKGSLSTGRHEATRMDIVERQGNLYIFQNTRNPDFYILRKQSTTFEPLGIVPEGYKATGIYKDEKNQLLFVYQNQHLETDQGGLLLDSLGQFWNYNPMLSNLPPIRKLASTDFLKRAYAATQKGAYLLTVGANEAIHTIDDGAFRFIRSNAQGELIVKYKDEFKSLINKEMTSINPDNCIAPYSKKNALTYLINDPLSNLWMKSNKILTRFEPNPDGSCEEYDLDFTSGVALFLSPTQLVAFKYDESQLVIYDLESRRAEPFEVDGKPVQFSGVVHYMIKDEDNVLWVASNTGLFKVDLVHHKKWHYGEAFGFEDHRVLVIEKDRNGLIWMGTASRGVHIFDPEQEKVIKIITRANGLSNNTVVNLLEDNDGDMWAGTYDGISLLNPDGNIIANFNTEDGLCHYEFNRYAHFKDKNGLLYMGTVQGLNIINPTLLKQQLKGAKPSQIYITVLSYYDRELDQQVTLRNPEARDRRICLKADQRNLSVNLGMSNYGYAEKNRYAYRLEGINDDWIYIGNDHQIDLFNLPAGDYKLIINGIDKNGNWAKTPVVLSIHAQEFFYKQAWFYLLLALPFLVFALIWVMRLRREKEMLENEVDKRTVQIRKSKELIEQQANELIELNKLRSRFFANISHELRTPLTLITGPTELLAQEDEIKKKPALYQAIRGVYQNARKLLNLVEEMLDLARIEAQNIQLKETAIHLHPYCLEIFEAFQPLAQYKKVDYQLSYELAKDSILLADQKRLEKILNNLLSNALKFTSARQSVHFRVYKASGQIHFEVRDTGRGIPDEDLPHVFERFFQSNRETLATEGGTGIGLSLSRELANLMQGDLTAQSEWGQGSTFTLQLPARSPESVGDAANREWILIQSESTLAQPPQGTSPSGSKGRILVVEDNAEVRTFIEKILKSKYTVRSVEDGQQALDYLSLADNPGIDLVLSDITMPNLDGYGLLDALKADPELQRIPVVMLTARIQQAHKLKALRLGVDDYLTKPFSPLELLARIENLLHNYRQREAFRQELLTVNPDFEPGPSVDQSWLAGLETIALQALEQQIDLNSDYLANEMALSTRQLSRRVKALTGLTIGRYIQEVKLQKARFLIENKMKTTIAEVAYACGFKSPGYFSQLFAQSFGKLPSDYPMP